MSSDACLLLPMFVVGTGGSRTGTNQCLTIGAAYEVISDTSRFGEDQMMIISLQDLKYIVRRSFQFNPFSVRPAIKLSNL